MDDTSSGAAAVVDAPASTPSTPASPSTTPSVSVEKGQSFAEALTARLAAPTPADPGVPKPVGDQPAPATAAPPQATTPPVESVPTPEAQGPIPFVNHKRILENARVKTEQEVTQRFQQQYAPHVALGENIRADAIGTVVGLVEGLANHPEYGPQMISALARTLGSRRGQQAASEEPQPDLQSTDGTLLYSAPQLAKREAWMRQQLLGEVDQRLQPLQTREQAFLAQEKEREALQFARASMSKAAKPYLEHPDFEPNRKAITTKWQSLVKEGVDVVSALGLAFADVRHESVLSRTAQSQSQLTATAVQKSLGSSSGPGAAPAAPAGRPKSFEDAFGRIRT